MTVPDFFRLKNGQNIIVEPDRMSGGDTETYSLAIKNVSRTDLGNYHCEVENAIGTGRSENEIVVDVLCKGNESIIIILS